MRPCPLPRALPLPALALAVLTATVGAGLARANPVHLSPDRAIDAPLRTTPAFRDQTTAALAFGAGVYLGVWLEPASARVLAARVDGAKGTLLDDPPLVVQGAANLDTPAVGFDGKRFLVVWSQNGDLYGAHVDPATGAVAQPFAVAVKANAQENPAVAGGLDGKGDPASLIVWEDAVTSPRRIHAALVNGVGGFLTGGNGKPLADLTLSTNGTFPSGTAIDAIDPAVAVAAPGKFLVAWCDNYGANGAHIEVMASSVDTTGAASAPARIDGNGDVVLMVKDNKGNTVPFTVPAKETREPTVAAGGAQLLVVWSDYRDDPALASLYGRLVAGNGMPVGGDFQVARPPGGDALLGAQAGFGAGGYLLAWEAALAGGNGPLHSLYAGRVSALGQPLDGDGVLVATGAGALGEGRRAALAGDGILLAVAWTREPQVPSGGLTGKDAMLTPLDPAHAPVLAAPASLQRDANLQRRQALATNGAVFLLVWEDSRGYATSGVDLYGMRFDPTGKPLDVDGGGAPQPFVICDQPGDQILPAVGAWGEGGGSFLVAWSDGRDLSFDERSGKMALYGTLVGSMGAPLEAAGHPLTASPVRAQLGPTVAAGPAGFVVAWEDWRTFVGEQPFAEIWSVPVGGDGKPGLERQVAGANPNDKTTINCAPVAAWNGSRFFVAWEQPCSQWAPEDALGASHLLGAWLAPDGSVAGDPLVVAANPKADEKAVAVAAGSAGSLLLAWRASKDGGNDEIRVGTLADQAQAVALLGSVDGSGVGVREAPAIAVSAPRGVGIVTWIDTSPAGGGNPMAGVYGVRVDGGLHSLDAAPFAFTTGVASGVFRVPVPPSRSFIFNPTLAGGDLAVLPRTTPPATVAAMPTGEALAAWAYLEALGGSSIPRLHQRSLGLSRPGGGCHDASQCGDGICTSRGVCCDTPCEGVCRTCTADGCVGVPATDSRCGAGQAPISCAALDTDCRKYGDLPSQSCAAFGQCAEPGNLAGCTRWTDAADGTPCSALGCDGGGATCRSGYCLCPGGAPRALPEWAAGCTVRGGGGAGGAAAGWVFLSLLSILGLARLSRRR